MLPSSAEQLGKQQGGVNDAALARQVHAQLEGFDVFCDLHGHTGLFAPIHLLPLTSMGRLS